MNKIHTENAPAAIGPYSQGYEVNGVVYTSASCRWTPRPARRRKASPPRRSRAARTWAPFWRPAALGLSRSLRRCASWRDMKGLRRL